MFAVARGLPAVVPESNFASEARARLLELCARPIEIFCRCPAAEAVRRYIGRERRAPHFDQATLPELEATLRRGVAPLGLGGPLLEVDPSLPVSTDAVRAWVAGLPEWDGSRSITR
jgi:hypothetical protein